MDFLENLLILQKIQVNGSPSQMSNSSSCVLKITSNNGKEWMVKKKKPANKGPAPVVINPQCSAGKTRGTKHCLSREGMKHFKSFRYWSIMTGGKRKSGQSA
jgi:hypothetical protein